MWIPIYWVCPFYVVLGQVIDFVKLYSPCVYFALLHAIDPSEAPCSVPAWRLMAMFRSLPLLNVFLPIILPMALWEVVKIRVMSYSIDCGFVVLLEYILVVLAAEAETLALLSCACVASDIIFCLTFLTAHPLSPLPSLVFAPLKSGITSADLAHNAPM